MNNYNLQNLEAEYLRPRSRIVGLYRAEDPRGVLFIYISVPLVSRAAHHAVGKSTRIYLTAILTSLDLSEWVLSSSPNRKETP